LGIETAVKGRLGEYGGRQRRSKKNTGVKKGGLDPDTTEKESRWPHSSEKGIGPRRKTAVVLIDGNRTHGGRGGALMAFQG